MSEWRDCVLGDYAKVLGGYAFKSADFGNSGDFPVIKIKNVASGTLNMTGCQYISQQIADSATRFRANQGDILIAMTGSHEHQLSPMVGKITRYSTNDIAYINQRVGKVYSKDTKKLNEDFLYYFLKWDETTYELAFSASGSVQANISAGQIEGLQIALPCIDEQQAIAEVLSSLDDKIGLLSRQNTTLEALAQTYFRQWFIEGVHEDWNIELLSRYVDITRGASPRPIIKYVKDGVFPWVKIGDATSSHSIFINSTKEKIIEEGINKSVIARKGDIILSNSATCGLPYIMGIDGCVHDGWLVFRNFRHLTKWYVYFLLQALQREIVQQADGTVQDNLNTAILKNVSIKVPDVESIQMFDTLAENIIGKIESNNAQILTQQKLRDTLLPKLISGEVSVKQ
jgi:type I restriction enzyme S subunit